METRAPSYILNPLNLAKNSHSKLRLTYLGFATHKCFCLLGQNTIQSLGGNLWTTKVFLYKFDISQGYHHIDIDENDKK